MIVKINNLKVNFEVYGNGNPIIILHGWGDNLVSWKGVAEILAGNYKTFLIDLPGFGESETPDKTWGIEEYSSFIGKFIKEFEIGNPIIIGHSMGGKIASFFASRPELNEDNIEKLVLISSSGIEKRNVITSTKIFLFKFLKLILSPLGKKGQKLLKLSEKTIGSDDYKDAGKLRKILVKLVNQRIDKILPRIKIPTLIIWGDKDYVLPVKLAKKFKKLIPNSRIRIIWGTGHFPHIEDPNQLTEIILEYTE